ncbi:AsnC family transcriptional regulator [Falsochrobactrum shanghaiense]|uniref:AsnC family transcriptional regulator n=1 Tax=Falsochrobactrum shanghaiense TaxID=2201899 RepID=A0A316JTG0_9HYPH|nr:Lrp/AsnC family transcriptional regulator [Falsochrobactrum shanghaiense]PWL18560.1 AsnC family transcriptional regulator [Falsochrobactrum shanghaiense]
MDDLDQRLISELRVNARASIPTLASILGVARGTVQNRMERLIASGVIAGFTVRLRDHGSSDMIRGIMMIELTGRSIKSVISMLRKNPSFSAVNTTNGAWDLIAEIEVADMNEFHRLITGIRAMEGVAKSETHIFLGPA